MHKVGVISGGDTAAGKDVDKKQRYKEKERRLFVRINKQRTQKVRRQGEQYDEQR